ncbi:MAG: pectate lyase [Lewinellaceae bacterium]|nr:pectate lyase [Lewinellaceae bacterium]
MKYLLSILIMGFLTACSIKALPQALTDETAEKMLLYQRANGGWPQYKGDATDYKKPISEEWKEKLLADKNRLDATIDDRSTTLEINYLLEAYDKTKNKTYLQAAERGIAYLLEAQNTAGGWPQFYPDSTNYRIHITYNDNAMIDVMWIMEHLAEDEGVFHLVDPSLRKEAQAALQKGIECILKTQVVQHGVLTVWCAQHDSQTLVPAQARKFEPPSLSGAESVGIVRFLMSIDHPSEEIKIAIRSAVKWFEQVKIEGWNYEIKADPFQPSGRDRVIFPEENSTIWARFYELDTFRPIFTGRDGIIHYHLDEIENERRVGYGYYGKWPEKLLEKEYPAWEKSN